MRAKVLLLAAYPRRETQVAALTAAGDRTVAACRQSGGDAAWRGSDSCRGREERVATSPPCWSVFLSVSSRASPASGLTVDGESLCTVSRSNSSIIYHNEVWGDFQSKL